MTQSLFARFCLEGLQRLYIPSEHVFAFSRRLVDGAMVSLRNDTRELKFSMNVLMGLRSAANGGSAVFLDIESEYERLVSRLADPGVTVEDVAAAVWTGRALGVPVPQEAVVSLREIIKDPKGLTAQSLAWAAAACLGDGETKTGLALGHLAIEHYVSPRTGLARHCPAGPRKDWASFAASCYLAYMLLLLARRTGSEWALEGGLRIAHALVSLQGPQGQWGWFYHVPSGRVADYYPVYSVHQHGMAPLFLLEALDLGYTEFREPLLRGFRWVLGDNELHGTMVDHGHRVIWRSAERRHPMGKLSRVLKAFRAARDPCGPRIAPPGTLRVNRECRSYELGWALLAFGGRSDFRELLDDPRFA